MNCAPDWRASVSNAVTRSPAGMSTGRVAGACAAARAGAEEARINSAPRSERVMCSSPQAGAHDAHRVDAMTSGRGKSPQAPLRSARTQHDGVPARGGLDREAARQQPHEGVGVGPAEVAAHAHGADPYIVDHDLALVVAVEL